MGKSKSELYSPVKGLISWWLDVGIERFMVTLQELKLKFGGIMAWQQLVCVFCCAAIWVIPGQINTKK